MDGTNGLQPDNDIVEVTAKKEHRHFALMLVLLFETAILYGLLIVGHWILSKTGSKYKQLSFLVQIPGRIILVIIVICRVWMAHPFGQCHLVKGFQPFEH